MISVCLSVLILVVFTISIVVVVPHAISNALPTNVAIAATPLISKNNKVAVDKFGITEIYPTKSTWGREWYMNTSTPLSDKSFSLSGGTEKTNSLANATSLNGQIVKQPDGSYQVYGVRK